MMTITGANVNEAFSNGLWYLKASGVKEPSRNGPVLVAPGPVMTTYTRPWERVLTCPQRDANHVFHLMEAIWMLGGHNAVEWLLQFNRGFGRYAEPDGQMWGAYGHRWREHFGLDQIKGCIAKLRADPTTRQAVLAMWDPAYDLLPDVRDRPCNTHVYFDCRFGKLNMTVCCRSNDMLWGAYGSNVVHFSMLQELIAWGVGMPVGTYNQFSNNFHLYTDLPQVQRLLDCPPDPAEYDEYRNADMHVPMCHAGETVDDFLLDCNKLIAGVTGDLKTKFMRDVALPLLACWTVRRASPDTELLIPHCDWGYGFSQWLSNREVDKAKEKAAGFAYPIGRIKDAS